MGVFDGSREEKSKEFRKYDLIRIRDGYYYVKSQTTNREYVVFLSKIGSHDTWECNCPDHMYRRKHCKHIRAIENLTNQQNQNREIHKVVLYPRKDVLCKYCDSENIVKDGKRRNKYGDLQKWFCRDCSKYFTKNPGFDKMKNDPKNITLSMQLYFSGESLRRTSKTLEHIGVNVSHQTVYNWIKKYTELMMPFLTTIIPQVGDAWRADEVFIKVRGQLKYLFSLMDDETRFWIAQEVADRKEGHDARWLFRKGKMITQTRPKVLFTDGLHFYSKGYKKEFWAVNRENRTLHIRHIHMANDRNNNKMERLNGEFRDREKVVRGIKKEDTAIIDGYQIYHNYVRPHMGLDGKTPAEACGIDVQGENKWKTLIQNASRR